MIKFICYGILIFPFLSYISALPNNRDIEICDNAIDDDGDGAIDLNDPDCECALVEPISLIPNPSFEETNCCPFNRSQLDCAKDWIQASDATTDYIHTCGWMGWEDLPVPLPLPDGEACVGYRNGRFERAYNPNWKEYAGACLLAPLRAGKSYRFRFHIGFTNYLHSPSTNIVFYGSPSCDNLPFGVGNDSFGCPTNDPGWRRLSSTSASGSNSWVVREFNVTPEEDIYAIAIGPDCLPLNATLNPYYFFDNLILASTSAFEFEIATTTHPCADDFTLQVAAYDSLQYQWYKDGIALLGETGPSLQVQTGEGQYQVRILSETECKLAKPYIHQLPYSFETIDEIICESEDYYFNGATLNEAGTYIDTLKTTDNCDSIVWLNLTIQSEKIDSIQAKILKGESYNLGSYQYQLPGQYLATFETIIGCDSIIFLDLDFYDIYIPNAFSPNDDGINDFFSIFAGEELVNINQLSIFDRWGSLVYRGQDLAKNNYASGWDGSFKGKNSTTGVYTYLVEVLLDDGKERTLSGSVLLIR